MERRPHDFAASSGMPYTQQQPQIPNFQQQQYGFHPQHQQHPSSVHASPFMPPHPSLQQFAYHHPLQQHQQQQTQQILPRPPPHPQIYGQHPPHFPPHLVPSPFLTPHDSAPPPPAAPPSDPELQKRIDKLVEYSLKNGPEFEAMIREKQKDNPEYSFLFGGEGHSYYRYKLWISVHPLGGHFNAPFPPASMPTMHHPPNAMMNPSALHAASINTAPGAIGTPQIHQPTFPPFHEQHLQHSHPFGARPEFDQASHAFKGLSGPLPTEVAIELNNVLINLNGTKESIKSAKNWFMQRSPFAPAVAEALRERVFAMDDAERQMHIVYLANDILFDSMQRRTDTRELDNEALAFRPILGSLFGRIYHNPNNKEENQSKLEKILQFWASKEVYNQDIISAFESEMKRGPPSEAARSLPHPVMVQQPPNSNITDQEHREIQFPPAMPSPIPNQQFIPNVLPSGVFPVSMPHNPAVALPANQPPAAVPSGGEKLPPYPLFPPGLIPGMVRKMQIGSGVPYSPLSPLDIPTVIPPSDVPQSQILERVSKFFKEIGEVNPSEGPMGSGSKDEEYDDYERDRQSPPRKGGACIPPPPNLQVDPETGTYPDGSVDRKPGGSGRLGLGATADPNEPSQYDDVYSSYRKQRSTNYHSTMSARSATR